MSRAAGRWVPVTLEGDVEVEVDGDKYTVPSASTVVAVRAGKLTFVHVKVGRSVYVLCAPLGQLDESMEEGHARSAPAQWAALVGERIPLP